MADFTVEVILKRPFFRSDSKLGSFLVTATELASSEQEGTIICGAYSFIFLFGIEMTLKVRKNISIVNIGQNPCA
jgi:hypothetical protein